MERKASTSQSSKNNKNVLVENNDDDHKGEVIKVKANSEKGTQVNFDILVKDIGLNSDDANKNANLNKIEIQPESMKRRSSN